MKQLLLAVITVLVLSVGTVRAGQLEDGIAAHKRGDYTTAFGIFWVLAAIGNAGAQYNLGVMYRDGQDPAKIKSDAEAIKWFRLAAAQEYALAQYSLGAMYGRGRGVGQDDAEATKWFRLAAEQRYANAQYTLGARYYSGLGVEQSYILALMWYWLAGSQGHVDAQNQVGFMFDQGQGFPQDYAEAVKWYRLAAAQGNAAGQTDLGFKYLKGQGVRQDYIRAHMWFNLGAASGNSPQAAKGRDLLAKRMTPTQIAQAQEMAQRCNDSQFKQCGEPVQITGMPPPNLTPSPDKAVATPQSKGASFSIPLRQRRGVFEVMATLNSEVKVFFVVDSGASDVTIPESVAGLLIDNGSLTKADVLGSREYTFANGETSSGKVVRLRTLDLNGHILKDVRAVVLPGKSVPVLLGQSALVGSQCEIDG